jgi:hypothetical protein
MQHRLLTAALLQGFSTAQELATAAGVSLDTARRYRRGHTYPDALTVARLMQHSRLVVDACCGWPGWMMSGSTRSRRGYCVNSSTSNSDGRPMWQRLWRRLRTLWLAHKLRQHARADRRLHRLLRRDRDE